MVIGFGLFYTNHLHLELAIFGKDILKVKVSQKISFTVPAATKEIFDAEVHLVAKSIESNERIINVHAHLDEIIVDSQINASSNY